MLCRIRRQQSAGSRQQENSPLPGQLTADGCRLTAYPVSSVGSEAMQQTIAARYAPRSTSAFSILGRIGGDATIWRRRTLSAARDPFQYPRSDRRRCNWFRMTSGLSWIGPFQYPRSDRRRCNSATSGLASVHQSLSVSSVGSEAMQPGCGAGARGPGAPFQYPRSDRRRCNDTAGVAPAGIGPFQYPRSDRRRCNDPRLGLPHPQSNFQYPRSDRRRCNWAFAAPAQCSPMSFSILGRIGGDATPQASQPGAFLLAFQYPRSDRRRCNGRGARCGCWP